MNWLRANFYKATTYALLAIAAYTALAYLTERTATAVANTGKARAETDLATANGKLAKAEFIATTVIEFNQGFQKLTQTLRGELFACQRGARKMRDENEDAVSRWMAEAKDADATLKKFYREQDQIRLQPANPTMAPIFAPADSVQIQGVVVGVMRKY